MKTPSSALFLALISVLIYPIKTNANAIIPPSITANFTNKPNINSPLGSNLTSVVDFAAEYPFINYFRMARPWFSAPSDNSAFQDNKPLSLDRNGNVNNLEATQVARTVLFTGLPADPGLAGMQFDLFYTGEGNLSYGNVTVISQAPGHDVIKLNKILEANTELTTIITIISTNPKNPLKNIRLLPKGGICSSNPLVSVDKAQACRKGDFKSFKNFHNSIVFNPAFLKNIQFYKSLRFMDWMRTNDSSQADFKDRPLPSHQFWSTEKGVPLEVMIALANLLDFDPWFNIPHRATDDYIEKFASIVNQQLEPQRRAYIEYSNEVWNGLFSQTAFALEKGLALGLDKLNNAKTDAPTGMVRFYSKRAQEVFSIFKTVMGGTSRIRRTLATQAVVPYFTEEILLFADAANNTDVFAIAPYFGDTITSQEKRDEMLKLGVDGVFDWLNKDNNTVLDFGSLPSIDRVLVEQLKVLDRFSIPLTSYEGGQHFLAAGAVSDDDALNALMDAVNRDPRMKTVYLDYLENWRTRTNEVFHHFTNSDRWSKFGRWGAKEFPSQPRIRAPKYDALLTFIASHK